MPLKGLSRMVIFLSITGCNHLFYHPDSYEYLTPNKLGQSYERLSFRSDEETLQAWKISAKGTPIGKILHFHGNAQNMTAHFLYVQWLADFGYDVYVFDYRGYGGSSGEPTRDGLVQDGISAIHFVEKQDSLDFFVLAQSLGGAVAIPSIAIAQPKSLKALIVESSFSSYRSITREKLGDVWLTWPLQWPLSFLVSNTYSAEDYAAKVSVRVLVVHGTNDDVVSFAEGEKLYKSFNPNSTKLWTIEKGVHTSAFRENSPWRKSLLDYLCSNLTAKTSCKKN